MLLAASLQHDSPRRWNEGWESRCRRNPRRNRRLSRKSHWPRTAHRAPFAIRVRQATPALRQVAENRIRGFSGAVMKQMSAKSPFCPISHACHRLLPGLYHACTTHVPGLYLSIPSQAHGLYLPCTTHVPGFERLRPVILHSYFFLLPSPQCGFGVALGWLWGGFRVAMGCLSVGYQHALGWL